MMFDDPHVKNWAAAIGLELRGKRKAAGLSLEELSLLSGAAVPTISHVERGNRDVKLSTLVALTQAMNADLADLIRKSGEALHCQDASKSGLDGNDVGNP